MAASLGGAVLERLSQACSTLEAKDVSIGTLERKVRSSMEETQGLQALLELLVLLGNHSWNPGWILWGKGPRYLSPANTERAVLDARTLGVAIELVDQAVDGADLPLWGYAELVSQLYDGVTEGLPYTALRDFARARAAAIMAAASQSRV